MDASDTVREPTLKTEKPDGENETRPAAVAAAVAVAVAVAAAAVPAARVTHRAVPKPYVIVKSKFDYPPSYPIVPPYNNRPSWKNVPAAPAVTATAAGDAVTLKWNVRAHAQRTAAISAYELFVCKETDRLPDRSMWTMLCAIRASALTMRCTVLTLHRGFTYHFALRAVDEHGRRAPFAVVKTAV